jgi:hypothetical protein
MIALTNFERSWATSALTTIFPAGAHPRVPGANVIDIGSSLEEVCQSVPVRVALGLRIAVWLFALAPLVFLRFRTLPHLDARGRERIVLSLLSSRVYVVRQLATLLKAFGALMFVASAGVRETIVKREAIVQIGLARKKEEDRHVA